MSRHIDADRLCEVLERNFGHTGGASVLRQLIDEQPTADVVEVVRCGDCVLHNNCVTEDAFKFSGIVNGYCCVGKRKRNVFNDRVWNKRST